MDAPEEEREREEGDWTALEVTCLYRQMSPGERPAHCCRFSLSRLSYKGRCRHLEAVSGGSKL